jgi:hypothetical protein
MDTHQLPVVIAAVDSRDVTEQKPIAYLSEVGDLLRPRLDAPRTERFRKRHIPTSKENLNTRRKSYAY